MPQRGSIPIIHATATTPTSTISATSISSRDERRSTQPPLTMMPTSPVITRYSPIAPTATQIAMRVGVIWPGFFGSRGGSGFWNTRSA